MSLLTFVDKEYINLIDEHQKNAKHLDIHEKKVYLLIKVEKLHVEKIGNYNFRHTGRIMHS